MVLTKSFDGSPATRKTTARVLWDDTNLYVAFDCEDPDVWGSKMNKDDDIYNEDAVEIFLDANGDGATYNELELSPHNVQFDANFVTRRSDLPTAMKWESGMKTNVTVRGTIDNDSDKDEGWSAEMQIPIAEPRSPCRTCRRRRATSGASTCTGWSTSRGARTSKASRSRRCIRAISTTCRGSGSSSSSNPRLRRCASRPVRKIPTAARLAVE